MPGSLGAAVLARRRVGTEDAARAWRVLRVVVSFFLWMWLLIYSFQYCSVLFEELIISPSLGVNVVEHEDENRQRKANQGKE